jgi:putative membrane protein
MKWSSIILASALFFAAGGAFAQGAATAAPGPTDAQIAHIVVTANQVDIDAGKLAATKGKSKAVRAFGKQMVTDHTGVNKQAVALVTKLKVTPQARDVTSRTPASNCNLGECRRVLRDRARNRISHP